MGAPHHPLNPSGRPRSALLLAPWLTVWLLLLPIAAGLAGTVLPAFGLLPAIGGHALGLEPWRTLLAQPGIGQAIGTTLAIGWSASLISLAIAALASAVWQANAGHRAWQGRSPARGLAWLRGATVAVLATPHAAIAIGLAFLIAPSGWVARWISPALTGWHTPPDLMTVGHPSGMAVVVGLVLKEVPYLLLMIGAALAQVDRRALIAARALGYAPTTAWLKVIGPQVYPRIRLPMYAVLAYSLSGVDQMLVLGPSSPPPLPVLALRWFGDPDVRMQFPASAAALAQALTVLGSILVWRALEWATSALGTHWIERGRRRGPWPAVGALLALTFAACVFVSLMAIVAMALWSVATQWRFPSALPDDWTLDTWANRLDGMGALVGRSLAIAATSTCLALTLTVSCLEAEHRFGARAALRSLWMVYLPLLVPQISFLFGAQIMLIQLNLDGGWPAVIGAHLLFVLPYVFLSLADTWRALDPRLLRSAAALGAGPWRTLFRVRFPLLLRPLSVATAVGFAVSIGLYLPTLFAGAGRISTLTTEALTLAAGADRRVIGAYAFLQAILPFAMYLLAWAVPAAWHRERPAMRPKHA